MKIDLRSEELTSAALEYDVCILGAGAAGIAAALQFLGRTDLSVCLIESGNWEPEQQTQSLYAGDITGFPHTPLDNSRQRFFGGSTNCWNGWCFPLDASDFTKRSWIAHSGWPISKNDLMPYYHRAQQLSQIDEYLYEEAPWAALGLQQPTLDHASLKTAFYQTSLKLRFGFEYRETLINAANITVLLNANVTQLQTHENGAAIRSVKLKTLQGNTTHIKAKEFILSSGGIETPRLLLASNDIQQRGIGNQHDNVGRYFMEHPYHLCAMVVGPADNPLLKAERAFRNGVAYSAVLCTGEKAMQAAGVAGCAAVLETKYDRSDSFYPQDQQLEIPSGYKKYYFIAQGEQSPNPSSRVVLSRKRDALGQRQADLDWKMTAQDRNSIIVMVEQIAKAYLQGGYGQVKLARSLIDPDDYTGFGAGNHHMGTTRMGNDPRSSVVDRNCTVHGVDNLHIASSSVFVTSGYANPTLTIMALSIRLADHVIQRLS